MIGSAHADQRRFGVMVDAGVPDGALASMVYRPWRFLRLTGGAGSNLTAPTVRGGMSLVWGDLSANVDAGHAFTGNFNSLARMVAGDTSIDVAALRRVAYDYVNLHVGFELGHDPVTFYVHGGVSYLRSTIHDAGETLSSADRTVTFNGDPTLRAWGPSVRVGLIIYFKH